MNYYKKFKIIVAVNNDSLIGIKEYGTYNIPWPMLTDDMIFFRKITTSTKLEEQINGIIMGYNTWTTLPKYYRKNTKRKNIIISKTAETDNSYDMEVYVKNFEDALIYASGLPNIDNIYIIGGSTIYDAALSNPYLETIYMTHVNQSYPTDNIVEQHIYFPLTHEHLEYFVKNKILNEVHSDIINDINKNISYYFKTYHVLLDFSGIYRKMVKNLRIRYEQIKSPIKCTYIHMCTYGEYQYLELIKKIMECGIYKETRNAITKSIFGYQLKYDLKDGYPLPTIKKSYPKTIFEELMWIIRGQTNVKILQEKNIHIWDKNSTKEYLAKYGLPYDEGDIGPGYGFQMRHFGAQYINCQTDYNGKGVDQLQKCIDLIKNDPQSRRIIIDLWNCMDVEKMSLPACHILYNFGVDLYENPIPDGKKGKLNCHLLQRSWDVLLGWNTTTAALLTYLLAHHCNLDPGLLVHSITDAHIYKDHIDSGVVDKLLMRIPRKMPILSFLNKRDNIEDYIFEDLIIENYYPAPAITTEMIA